jgi:hypothetical protein
MIQAVLILSLLLPTGRVHTDHAWGNRDSFQIKSESVVYCAATDSYEFEIKFTEKPDFYTREPGLAARHAFLYFVFDGEPVEYKGRYASAVLDGIYEDGNIYIRPVSGGAYGDISGGVGYSMHNKTLWFSVPSGLIGLSGGIYTRAHTLVLGRFTGHYHNGQSTISKKCGHGIHTAPAQVTTWGHIKSAYR